MGVFGLTGRVHRKYSRRIDSRFFKDAEIYIDGPSLAHSLLTAQFDLVDDPTCERYIKDTLSLFRQFKEVCTSSVEVFFDGVLPESKTGIRLTRRQKQVSDNGKKLPCIASLLYFILKENFGDMTVEIVSEEADDAVASRVMAKTSNNRQIIISNDSDFYTYEFPGDVEVLSFGNKFTRSSSRGNYRSIDGSPEMEINLPTVAVNVAKCRPVVCGMIGKLLKPVNTCRESQLEQAFLYLKEVHEFINMYHETGALVSYLPVLQDDISSTSAWSMGKIYRSHAYTIMIKDYSSKMNMRLPIESDDHGHMPPVIVTEYGRTKGGNYVGTNLPIFLDSLDKSDHRGELDCIFENPRTVARSIVKEFEDADENEIRKLDRYLLEDLEIYLTNIFSGNKQAVDEGIYFPLIPYLQACIYSRLMLELALHKVSRPSEAILGLALWNIKKGREKKIRAKNDLIESLDKLKIND